VRGASDLVIKVNPDVSRVVAVARVVARHLSAMADELEALNGDAEAEVPQ